jgi:hypothetical protein
MELVSVCQSVEFTLPAVDESPITAKRCCPVGMKHEVKKNVSEIHLFTFVIQTARPEMDVNRKKILI